MIAGNPGYVSLSSYMHWTTPNTPPCQNSLDPIVGYVGPYGSASATSLHPGGVNVCFRRRVGAFHQEFGQPPDVVGARQPCWRRSDQLRSVLTPTSVGS